MQNYVQLPATSTQAIQPPHTSESKSPTRVNRDPKASLSTSLLVVLASLTAVAPFGIDMYLPAFPKMASSLSASASSIQLTLTTFLLGLALGQLVFGPLSDRIGRFTPLLAGMTLLVVSSAVAAIAPSAAVLTAARFVQGFTGSAGIVIGRAIISDLAEGPAAARAFNLMTLVTAAAPIVAPVAGSLLVGPIGWRGIMWVLTAIGAVMLVATVAVVRESHPASQRSRERGDHDSSLRTLCSRGFLAYTIVYVFAFGAMTAYISASPFVFQKIIGMTPVENGLIFGFNSLGVGAAGAMSARLVSRVGPELLADIGVGLIALAAAVLAIITFVHAPIWLVTLPLFVCVVGVSAVLGNATALALAFTPRAPGAASAALGAAQFGVAALVSPLVGIRGEHTATPMALCILVAAALACAGVVLARRRASTPPLPVA